MSASASAAFATASASATTTTTAAAAAAAAASWSWAGVFSDFKAASEGDSNTGSGSGSSVDMGMSNVAPADVNDTMDENPWIAIAPFDDGAAFPNPIDVDTDVDTDMETDTDTATMYENENDEDIDDDMMDELPIDPNDTMALDSVPAPAPAPAPTAATASASASAMKTDLWALAATTSTTSTTSTSTSTSSYSPWDSRRLQSSSSPTPTSSPSQLQLQAGCNPSDETLHQVRMVLGISVATCEEAACLGVIRIWVCTRDVMRLPVGGAGVDFEFDDCFTALYQFPGSVSSVDESGGNGPASSAWVDFCAVWDQYSSSGSGAEAPHTQPACPQPFDQKLPAGTHPELAGYVENICSTHHFLFWDQMLGTLASGFYDPDAESWVRRDRRGRRRLDTRVGTVSGVGMNDPIEPILIACFNRETSFALVPVDPVQVPLPLSVPVPEQSSSSPPPSSASSNHDHSSSVRSSVKSSVRRSVVMADGTEVAVEARRMVDLMAGDKVISLEPQSGKVIIDRVSMNLHRDDNSKNHHGVTLHLHLAKERSAATPTSTPTSTSMSISVTTNHVLLINGRAMAAGKANLGDSLRVVWMPQMSQRQSGERLKRGEGEQGEIAQITAITKWRGGIVNPITSTGFILAGNTHINTNAHANTNANTNATSIDGGGGLVLASTVIDSPHNVQLTLATMPSLLKAISLSSPGQLQASNLAESAILAVVAVSHSFKFAVEKFADASGPGPVAVFVQLLLESLGWLISLGLFVATDLCVGCVLVISCACSCATSCATSLCLPQCSLYVYVTAVLLVGRRYTSLLAQEPLRKPT